ncbi:MAG: pyrroline-5-carboxylate reductase [Clostridia bacterium]|nr:pyrroline-5-carboxylate reductase [Clostridia bacterium]
MKYTFGFIGCGNMGGALVRAAAKNVSPEKIAVCDRNDGKLAVLETECGVTREEIRAVAAESKFIVLGVKPQGMQAALDSIADVLKTRSDIVLVTMAAGLSADDICRMAGKEYPVIRIMPNTPCLLGEGMILYTAKGAASKDVAVFLKAFEKAGVFDWVDEELMDVAGAISGCGPAFAYAFAEALALGGVSKGLSKEKGVFYAAQAMIGAGKMLLTGEQPQVLIDRVCSPGGTTLAGMAALEKGNFQETAKSAVDAAYARTKELKK